MEFKAQQWPTPSSFNAAFYFSGTGNRSATGLKYTTVPYRPSFAKKSKNFTGKVLLTNSCLCLVCLVLNRM